VAEGEVVEVGVLGHEEEVVVAGVLRDFAVGDALKADAGDVAARVLPWATVVSTSCLARARSERP
jgi:hypothetical protein